MNKGVAMHRSAPAAPNPPGSDPSEADPAVPWHALSAEQALDRLQAGPQGLGQDQAAQRLARFGPNALPAGRAAPAWRRLLAQFNDPLILFLLCAAVVSLALGHATDGAIIVAVVLVNAVVGFVQEGRAEQALAALGQMIAPRAHALRGGQRITLAVSGLVPGDVILLEAGDRVPADARVLRARNLQVDESILTGESVPAHKSEAPVAAEAPLAEHASILHSGTLVATGQASAVVVATGSHTQIGRIGRLLGEVQDLTTPLIRQIRTFGRRFTLCALLAALALYVFAVFARDYHWLDALMVVVALAVGAVPEGLPAVITITLAIGVRRMAARRAIVRRLPAVETLGATTVICSDKTGTLTRNEMTAHTVVAADGRLTVSGAGYAPQGTLELDEGQAHAREQAEQIARVGLLCNDAQLRGQDGDWRVAGDPMEGALLALAAKAGLDEAGQRARYPRVDEIPFDAAHRYMATLHDCADGTAWLCVKGAPEQVLALSRAESLGPGGLPHWEAAIGLAGERGERVLGFAMKRLDSAPARLSMADVAGLDFLGLVGFIDPPREEAIEAVAQCRAAGIAVKMITGDHAATALTIARQLRLAERPEVLTGAQLQEISDAELVRVAQRASVFARTNPEHKLRLVRALQSTGQTVAMTGDGVNDAPALKQADIGIAMGHKGTEAAKQASEMVLADDNFSSIAAAVHEGRAVYDNIRKVVAWTLPTNGGEALAVVAALALGTVLPMTPAQILWINMVLTITLGLALAFEPPEPGIMRRPPRRRDAQLISPFMLWRILLVSALFTVAAFGIFWWATARGLDTATARTMVVNTFCVMEIFYLFSVRYLHGGSFTWQGLRGTPVVLAAIAAVTLAQAAFTYLPAMQGIFDSRALGAAEALVVLATGPALLLLLEGEKWVLQRLGWFEEIARVKGEGVMR
ncbi:HAD-IC family P-type ATPase [Orrella sp. JC864]|uniref:cation-translocating P-type ATPase n=1 Tax=Orrella sp. JC864 TaxID=3120298 RepID=UPI0030090609